MSGQFINLTSVYALSSMTLEVRLLMGVKEGPAGAALFVCFIRWRLTSGFPVGLKPNRWLRKFRYSIPAFDTACIRRPSDESRIHGRPNRVTNSALLGGFWKWSSRTQWTSGPASLRRSRNLFSASYSPADRETRALGYLACPLRETGQIGRRPHTDAGSGENHQRPVA